MSCNTRRRRRPNREGVLESHRLLYTKQSIIYTSRQAAKGRNKFLRSSAALGATPGPSKSPVGFNFISVFAVLCQKKPFYLETFSSACCWLSSKKCVFKWQNVIVPSFEIFMNLTSRIEVAFKLPMKILTPYNIINMLWIIQMSNFVVESISWISIE